MNWDFTIDNWDPPTTEELETADFDSFGDQFDMLNDGSGYNLRTASTEVFLDFKEGKVIFPKVRFNLEEYIKVWGTLVIQCPFSILQYKVTSKTSEEEATKWLAWAKDQGIKLSDEEIEELRGH